jgi:hypothetical protein
MGLTMTRWSLIVSDETDKALRAFLGQQGARKGALSAFVEKAVRDRLERRQRFHALVEEIQNRNAQFDQQEIMDAVDEAVAEVRAERS